MAWRDDSFPVALRISNLANPMLTQKILLVEDEQAIADTLIYALGSAKALPSATFSSAGKPYRRTGNRRST